MLALSVSRVKLYEECPRKFRYQYIDKLPQQEKSFFVLGTFVHKALEECVKHILYGRSAKDAMYIAFRIARKEVSISSHMLAQIYPWLCTFVQQWVTSPCQPLRVEAKFSFPLEDRFKIRGVIDRIDRHGEGIHVIDYKTSRKIDMLDDFQLAVYATAARQLYPDKSITAWFSMVRFDFVQACPLVVTDIIIEQALQRLFDAGVKIEQEQEWPTNHTPKCRYCDYFKTCFTESPDVARLW